MFWVLPVREFEPLLPYFRKYGSAPKFRIKEIISHGRKQKPYLSVEEQLKEVKLKKLKLHAKDLIQALEHRAPAVA